MGYHIHDRGEYFEGLHTSGRGVISTMGMIHVKGYTWKVRCQLGCQSSAAAQTLSGEACLWVWLGDRNAGVVSHAPR